ncbi:exo-beta-N-acetylmuramidase NamZ domain-containing protein [Terriglobus roseus]|uniref:Uncharacterized conserved protein YbbC, DUF1343 family n=1 Tax=Terriglobus roseus TaxID=392734 RepID=A0A1G7HQF8_9BACT|nr:DUF1343 domain-containing protein [Terriglobus roseus]SDF02249.1 Uncharacterized conserved protein YbbC, DUF1343 family [Terriglobus roseus]
MKYWKIGIVALLCVAPLSAQVKTGIDVLEDDHFSQLKQLVSKHGGHLRLGVLTNPVGIDGHERRTIDVLRTDAPAAVRGLTVTKLFSAEHGINAAVDNVHIVEDKDPSSGLPIVSLFGATEEQRHPSKQQLEDLDAIVIDLQDVGVRYWTFQTLVKYFVEASAANHLSVVVLDRPNPVNGLDVQGPLSTQGRENYVNPISEPMRPGMTMGELAQFFNGEEHLGADLTVIKMAGWKRQDWWDDSGLLWVNPSPNIRTLTQNLVYLGTGLLEGTNVNVKGPTEPPFVRFGAPWIVATDLARYLNNRKIPGVTFMAISYVPTGEEHYPYRGQRVEGVEVIVNDRSRVDAPELGIEAVSALWKLYPKDFQIDRVDRLLLNKSVLEQIKKGVDPQDIAKGWQQELNTYKVKRARYLIY